MAENNLESISEVDLAYQILVESGKEHPLHFKKWILEIIARKGMENQYDASTISEIYTLINMDSRFQHIGDGIWGLSDWYPPETKRSRSTSARPEKSSEKKTSLASRLKSVSDEEFSGENI